MLGSMTDGFVVTDAEMDRTLREVVEQLRRALRESAVVAHDLRTCRDVLVRVGVQVQDIVLSDGGLICGGSAVEPWPTRDELCTLLELDRRLRERIEALRGTLSKLGIGPDLFGPDDERGASRDRA